MDQEGLLFPKPGKKKKKKMKSTKSIMHEKEDGTCYLCMLLDGNHYKYEPGLRDEHHVFPGPDKAASERYGLKVYLCKARHHVYGKDAVHENPRVMRRLQDLGQQAFEREYPGKRFNKIFRKNYSEVSV